MANTTVSVTAASTLIHTPTNATESDQQAVSIYNNGSQTVYVTIGANAATAAVGIPVAATGSIDFVLHSPASVIRAIVTSGTAELRVMADRA